MAAWRASTIGMSGRDLLESVRSGDIPGVGIVLIDGVIRCNRGRHTPRATRVSFVVEGAR